MASPVAAKAFRLEYLPEESLSWVDSAWGSGESVGTGIDDAVRMLRDTLGEASLRELNVVPNSRKQQKLCSIQIGGDDRKEIRLCLHDRVIARTERVYVQTAMTKLAQAAQQWLEVRRSGGSLVEARVALEDVDGGEARHGYRSRVSRPLPQEPLVSNDDDMARIVALAAARVNHPLCTTDRIRFKKSLQTHDYHIISLYIMLRPGFVRINAPVGVLNKLIYVYCHWLVSFHSQPPVPANLQRETIDAMVLRAGGRIELGIYVKAR